MEIYDLRVCGAVNPLNAPEKLVFSFKTKKLVPVGMRAHIYSAAGELLWRSDYLEAGDCGGNTIAASFIPEPLSGYYFTILLKLANGTKIESERSYFETGFLGDGSMGGAKWIGSDTDADSVILSRRVDIPKNCARIRLYTAAFGFVRAYINGEDTAPLDIMSPVWSDYHKRDMEAAKPIYPTNDRFSYTHYYNAADVTAMLKPGENTLSLLLGDGWYGQDMRNVEGHFRYGTPKAKFAVICYDDDGAIISRITSDENTLVYRSPITSTNVYYGESRDARLGSGKLPEGEGSAPAIFPERHSTLRPQLCPADRIRFKRAPTLISEADGIKLYDKGQNGSGRVRVITSAPAGSMIKLTFAENIADGKLDFTSTGSEVQIQSDSFITDGGKGAEFAPLFSVHGYRYFTVEGEFDSLVCEEINSDVPLTFAFDSSSETLNGIVGMYINSQLSNMHTGVPSDCPHRERLGYTGDGQVSLSSALLLGESRAFWRKWLRDIADSQCRNTGHVQHTAPYYGGGGGPGAWGGAMVYVPWKLYLHTGDKSILAEYYPNMSAWVDYMLTRCNDYIVVRETEGGWCLGDWCNFGGVKTSAEFVNSALFAEQLGIMCKIAKTLGDARGERRWASLVESVREAVEENFLKDGTWDCGINGAPAFAVAAGIESAKKVAPALEAYRTAPLDTGFVGTPLLLDALFEAGLGDVALELLLREEKPSFGYMLKNGATTIWEDFEGVPASHNHPMFGAFVSVLARRMMGIAPDEEEPGYGTLFVEPYFPASLTHASMTVDTPHGNITSKWHRDADGKTTLELTIPSDVKLKLRLPSGCACRVNRG